MSNSGGRPPINPIAADTTASANQVAAANVAAVATLAASPGQRTWLTFALFTVGSAAAVVNLLCTITGLAGGTWSLLLGGGTALGDQIPMTISVPIPSAAVNTAVVATIPASGVAGPPIAVQLAGYYA